MSTKNKTLAGLVLFSMCLLANVGVQVARWRSATVRSDLDKHFAMLNLQTNSGKGTFIVERQTDKPVWGKWDFEHGQSVSFYFEGKNIVDVFRGKKGQTAIEVTFFGDDGKKLAVWGTKGTAAGFNERTLFGNDGPKKQVWFNETWQDVHLRTNDVAIQSGIILGEKWRHLILTNGAIALEP